MKSAAASRCFNFASNIFDGWARRRPQSLALWCVDGVTSAEQKFTFQELSRLSAQAANVFRSQGLRQGDRVLLMLPRVWQWWAAMLGLTRLGAVPVPATLQLTPRDVAYRLQTARIRAVLTNAEGLAKVAGFDGLAWPLARRPRAGWISTRP